MGHVCLRAHMNVMVTVQKGRMWRHREQEESCLVGKMGSRGLLTDGT